MSTSNTLTPQPWIDVSSHEGKRRTLRTLIKAVVVLTVLYFASDFFWPLPKEFQQVVDQQWETMPQRRLLIFFGLGCLLIGCGIAGLWKLWNYKSEGTVLLCIFTLVPPFPMTGLWATAATGTAVYLGTLSELAVGMLLLFCWTQKDVFEPAREAAVPVQETDG